MKKKVISLLLALAIGMSINTLPAQALQRDKVTWFGNEADYSLLLDSQYPQGVKIVNLKGQLGMINKYGKMVIPNIYNKLTLFDGGLVVAKKGDRFGVLNTEGKEIIPFKYDKIFDPSPEGTIFRVLLNGKHGFYRKDGKKIADTIFDSAHDFNGGAAVVYSSAKKAYGAIDTNGKLVIDFKYSMMGKNTRFQFWNGRIVARDKKNYTGVLDTKGKIRAPFIYTNGWSLDGAQGPGASFLFADYRVIPEAERIIISKDTAPLYVDGRKQAGRVGIIDYNGKEILPFKYELIRYLQKEKAFKVTLAVEDHKSNNKIAHHFIVDVNGKLLTPKSGYTGYSEMHNGVRVASKSGKYGALNAKNKEVVPFIYEELHAFNKSGTAWAKKGGKWGLINKNGKTVVKFEYSNVNIDAPETYSEVPYNRADTRRIRNMAGDIGKRPGDRIYAENSFFAITGQSHSEQTGEGMIVRGEPLTGIARVTKNSRVGYISPTGKVIAECIYISGTQFDMGRALVKKIEKAGTRVYIIDDKGRELNPNSQINYITRLQWGTRKIYPETPNLVTIGNYSNYLTSNGRLLLDKDSRYAQEFFSGIAKVFTGLGADDFGYIDVNGKFVIPPNTYTAKQVAAGAHFSFIVENGEIGYIWNQDLGDPPPYKPTFEFVDPIKNLYTVGDAFQTTGFNAVMLDQKNKKIDISKEVSFKSGAVELYDGYIWKNPGNKTISCYYDGKVERTFTLAVESTDVLADGVYTLDGSGSYFSMAQNTNWLMRHSYRPAEKFRIKSTSEGYTIQLATSGYLNCSLKNGDPIYKGNKQQQWKIKRITGDKYVIRAIGKENYVMNFKKTSSADGSGVSVVEISGAIPINNLIRITPAK